MTKYLLSGLFLGFCNLSYAGDFKEANARSYLFAGDLSGMASSLETQLAAEIRTKCPTGSAEVRQILILLQQGPAASGDTMTTNVKSVGQKDVLQFQHPSAKASAVFKCRQNLL